VLITIGILGEHCSNLITAVIPFGRFAPLRPDLVKATKPEEEGGNGNAQKFWEWNEEQVKSYL
jgi:retinol dehydrogenase-12